MTNYATVIDRNPVVRVGQGLIRGENREGVAIFRGIPYGAPCDGARRFLPPLPAARWDGVRDCTKNGPIAVQFGTSISGSGDFGTYFSGGKPELFRCDDEVQDENCLVLNVLTPGLDDKKRPVLVYLHGGGFATGSGSLVLGADPWVREEDLVVVGINHRLNVFGALHLGAFDPKYAESGMAGMLDCVLALEWVRDNIAAFGGDPAKVTIMGESGGGGKVNNLIAMERARGLFRAAIVESGSGAPGRTSIEDATALAQALLDELGVPNDQLEQLQSIPAQEILQASGRLGAIMGFGPVADGINLPYNPAGVYLEADPSLPLLVGSSEEEMAAFADPTPGGLSWDQLREKLLAPSRAAEAEASEAETPDDGKKRWAPKGKRPSMGGTDWITEDNVDAIIAAFRAIDRKGVDPEHIYYQIVSMGGPLGGGAFLQALAKAEKGCAPVYAYFFTFDAPHPRHPSLRFAWHTADLPLQMRVVAYADCEQISREMAHAWAAYIRTGSPSTEELPWPAFTATGRETMVLDTPCRVENDPTRPYRDALA